MVNNSFPWMWVGFCRMMLIKHCGPGKHISISLSRSFLCCASAVDDPIKGWSVYKPYKWMRLALVSVWTRSPLRLASVWEVTGSTPTAATVTRCRVLEQEAERPALYHCNADSFVHCEHATFLQTWFHLMWLMVFITKCCRLLVYTAQYFKSTAPYITWNVTFRGIFQPGLTPKKSSTAAWSVAIR